MNKALSHKRTEYTYTYNWWYYLAHKYSINTFKNNTLWIAVSAVETATHSY